MAQVSYLVSFVRSLIENDNSVIQEENKRKLETEYSANGSSLNKNLADKYEQVSKILSVYRYISERVKSNRSGVAIIKDNLMKCKTLLQCNRDDLRRLWLELIEKRHCVKLLETLEDVRIAPELVTSLTESKHWTQATMTVVSAQRKICNGLEKVAGVQPIRVDLEVRQKTLINRLKSEMHNLIFTDILKNALHNLSSFGERRASERSIGKKVDVGYIEDSSNERDVVVIPQPFSNLSLSDWRNISMDNEFWSDEVEDFDIKKVNNNIVGIGKFMYDERKYPQYIVSTVFSLHQFNKLQELLNEWSLGVQPQPHLFLDDGNSTKDETFRYVRKEINKCIIIKSIEHIKRSALSQNDTRLETFEDCRYLLDLLELLYIALFQCQSALMLMERAIAYLKSCKRVNLSNAQTEELNIFFDQMLIRKTIQNELKNLLNVHLRTSDTNSILGRSAKYDNEHNLANPEVLKHYMGKKKGILSSVQGGAPQLINDPTKQPLFKFSNSCHALSVSACLEEMRPLTLNTDDVDKVVHNNRNTTEHLALVCKPSHNNITAIYASVMDFIETLEAEGNYKSSVKEKKKPCLLRVYIHDFIENVFLEEFLGEMNKRLNASFHDQGAVQGLMNLVSQASERELGLQRPIIVVMLTADQSLEEIKRITMALRHYAIQCLRNGFKVMEEFKNNLWIWFKELFSLDINQDIHMSTEWGKDEDFIRFWKGFPSWQKMSNIDLRENFHHTDYSDLNLTMNTDIPSSPSAVVSNQQFKILSGDITLDTSNNTLLEEREARLLINQESEHLLRLIKDELKSQTGSSKDTYELKRFTIFQKNDLIKQMARLHESVAWFVQRTARFQTWLISKPWLLSTDNEVKDGLQAEYNTDLNKVINDFANLHNELNHLADACLLSIHLEGRLRAYNCIVRLPYELSRTVSDSFSVNYSLLNANYSCILDEVDVDPQVSDFVKSLSELEMALTHSLTRHKFRFVFEGLGNFVSALLVQILSKIKVMTTSGIKKMCCNIHLIQQTLSVLTQTHEMDLVRVKQLYELLYIPPEVVVNRIMEQGAVYGEDVYRNVLNLYQQSHSCYGNDKLQEALTKLSEVINMEYV